MNTKSLSVIFLIMIGLSVCGPLCKAQQKRSLTVMTYNIHHANPPAAPGVIDLNAIAEVINNASPDLVALQELDIRTKRSGGVDELAELARLTHMHYFFSKGIDFEGGEYGIGILSRFEIDSAERYLLPSQQGLHSEQRSLAVATVSISKNQQLNFACTHLGLRKEHRILQVANINEILGKRKLPVILAGDFNLQANTPAMKVLERYFTRSCTLDCAPTIPDHDPTSEIDFIFLKKQTQFKVTSHRVLNDIHASDHLPIVVTYSW